MIFGLYEYNVSKSENQRLSIRQTSCLEFNMPSDIHRAFDCGVATVNNSGSYDECKKYFGKLDGSILYPLIYGLGVKDLYPDIKGYWCFKSAFSSNEFVLIGDVLLKGKKLKFCMKISLPNTMKLYVCEEECLSSVMFNVDEPYCLQLRSDSSTLRYIKDAC